MSEKTEYASYREYSFTKGGTWFNGILLGVSVCLAILFFLLGDSDGHVNYWESYWLWAGGIAVVAAIFFVTFLIISLASSPKDKEAMIRSDKIGRMHAEARKQRKERKQRREHKHRDGKRR
jgi:uncharacterized membrane protein YccC